MIRSTSRLVVQTHSAMRRWASHRRDRGDVPGWVLITVMTAGLVSAIWLLAGPTLTQMFQEALGKVSGK
jgi:hypothetical protein